MTRFRCLVWIFLVVTFAQSFNPGDVEVPEGLKNRLLSGSTQGPMSAYFRGNQTATKSLLALKKHMQEVDDRLQSLYKTKQPYGLGPDDYICNRRAEQSIVALTVKLRDLGLPAIQENCTTEINMNYNRREQSDLWRNRLTFTDATKLAGVEAVRTMNRADWKNNAYPHAKFGYVDHIDSCQLVHNVGFRIRGKWAVMVSLTQFPVFVDRGDRRRQYIVEYLTSENGVAGNIIVKLPKMIAVDQDKRNVEIVANTTTTWENWLGRPGSSIFRGRTPPGENPAIAEALSAKADWREQVEDSRAASNISILTLSCLFTLIPLASIADVSMLALFVYTIATDIVSCIPLSIKGIELLQANRRHDTTVVWAFGGLQFSEKHSLVVESWSASCETKSDVRYAGVGLLLFALVMMVVGVILEIYASSRMKRRKASLSTQRLRENNERLKQQWNYATPSQTPCQECNSYHVPHANASNLIQRRSRHEHRISG